MVQGQRRAAMFVFRDYHRAEIGCDIAGCHFSSGRVGTPVDIACHGGGPPAQRCASGRRSHFVHTQ